MNNNSHATTVLCVRHCGRVAMMADGQVTLGHIVCKNNAKKIRTIADGKIVVGFAGAVADCLALIDKLEQKITQHSGQFLRSIIELAKDWRTDKYFKNLEASLIVANADETMVIGGSGEVIEVEDGIASVGSGSVYAIAAARGIMAVKPELSAMEIASQAMKIAADMCIYTNHNFTSHQL